MQKKLLKASCMDNTIKKIQDTYLMLLMLLKAILKPVLSKT